MHRKFLILKNISHEGPGLFGDILNNNQISFDVVDLSVGDSIPDKSHYDAAIILGGPQSANDQASTILNELKWIEECQREQFPLLGVCLGLQLMVKAGGGEVIPSPIKEIGWLDDRQQPYEVVLTERGSVSHLFEGIQGSFKLFQLHGETVSLKENMVLLGAGEHCEKQVVQCGAKSFGFQGHIELTPEMLSVWLDKDADLKLLNKEAFLKDSLPRIQESSQVIETIFQNYLNLIYEPANSALK